MERVRGVGRGIGGAGREAAAGRTGRAAPRHGGALEPGNDARRRATKKLWTGVEAQSAGITWNYALMLAGLPGVKADRMVTRFVSRALDGVELSPETAAFLVRKAARQMGVPATDLDHAIWRKESDRPVSVDPDDEQQPVLEEADDVDNRDLNAR
ncbi:hypothetical protein A5637_10415 [Mycolicibacterium fortuitum]|uniref:hypothetical protein n=1 Tax=Mycolicibacterium fortuitum TaxID=1766 RepID=UPI0007EDDBBF|nr:hypothetical protein [Mycolicibacterium fortuitum]OBK05191.1 hypothetical protein A5637_10415 [Mycolicibacterium fortuitum]